MNENKGKGFGERCKQVSNKFAIIDRTNRFRCLYCGVVWTSKDDYKVCPRCCSMNVIKEVDKI